MDSDKKTDVVDWQDSPPPVIPRERAPRRFLSPTLIGMLGTLLLHTMVIQSLPFGTRAPKAKPPETQESTDALTKSKADPIIESLVLIALPDAIHSREPAIQNAVSSLADLSKMKIKSPVNVDPPALLNLETLALSEDPASKLTSDGGDAAEQARLFGIYTGQMQARIDRVWRRPRTPINEEKFAAATTDNRDSFQCEAQIIQDNRGNVQEILLPRCNGSAAWQRSLVLAIQHASPLPAPPSEKVFSTSITLNFVGLSYVAGAPDDAYEPTRRTLMGAQ
jgi:hypothetical protein